MPDTLLSDTRSAPRPAAAERRLVLRLLAHWRHLAGDRPQPSIVSIDPDGFDDMWPWCFTIDVAGHAADPVLRAIGAGVGGPDARRLAGARLSQLPPQTLIQHATEYWREPVARRIPVSRGGQFLRADGTPILFRSILLPLGEDAETVGALLGGATCREVVGQ